MPPKKGKSALAAPSSSAPVPVPQRRATRQTTAHQRRNSDASTTTEAVPSSAVKKTPAKRGRPKTKATSTTTTTEELIAEDDELESMGNELSTPAHEASQASGDHLSLEDEVPIPHSPMKRSAKRVHFGAGDDEDDDMTEATKATNITPHLRKMSIKRRRSDSPSANASVKRVKSSRTSLPAFLSPHQPSQIIQEHTFAPLRVVLEKHIQRRSGVKSQERVTSIDAQLDGTVDIPDDDMLVLDTHEELRVTQLPSAPNTPIPNGQTPKQAVALGSYDRTQWAAERQTFHDAIIALQQEADEATGRLRILNIEIDSLGVAAKGTPALNVLQSIRESFAQAREMLEMNLPGSLPEDASNGDMTSILVTTLQQLADRLRTADSELEEKDALVTALGAQIHGVLDQMADKEIEKSTLRSDNAKLSQTIDERVGEVANLQEHIRELREEKDSIQTSYDGETAKVAELNGENEDLQKNVARLSESLQKYQSELTELTNKFNNMEDEHRRTVAAMNKEREVTVRSLEAELDDAMLQREQHDTAAQQNQDAINELQTKIDAATSERDSLQAELEQALAERDEEKTKREGAETELEEKEAEAEDLEGRVRRLEDELGEYEEELKQLRQLGESERQQREAAETELDGNQQIIEELNEKLREQGVQANELRSKLFEVRTENEHKIRELENLASERDVQFQEDMTAEVARRESAETLAQGRAVLVESLEQQLEDVERETQKTLEQRDEQLARLNDEAAQKEAEIQTLGEQLTANASDHENKLLLEREQVTALERDMATLRQLEAKSQSKVTTLQERIQDMTEEHEMQTEERDAKLAILEAQLVQAKVQQGNLEAIKTELERKVQDEAEFLLHFQNEKNAQVEEMKHALRDKQTKIQTVEDKAREADRRWQDVLAARDEHIAQLMDSAAVQEQSTESLRQRFAEYMRRSSAFIVLLQERVDAEKVFVEEDGGALMGEGEALLQELQGSTAKEPNANGVLGMKDAKSKGKKRMFDSGIGMAESPVNGGSSKRAVLLV